MLKEEKRTLTEEKRMSKILRSSSRNIPVSKLTWEARKRMAKQSGSSSQCCGNQRCSWAWLLVGMGGQP